MGDNIERANRMASSASASAPVPRWQLAALALSGMASSGEAVAVLRQRLYTPERPELLPALSRDEEPADIFVDLVEHNPQSSLASLLRQACQILLTEMAGRPHLTYSSQTGELCYLAARIGSLESVPALRTLVEHHEAPLAMVQTGENLRVRALRCLVGLLGSAPASRDEFQGFFERFLTEPGCELVALTGLLGLWPESRSEILSRLPAGFHLDETLLKASLTVAGFRSHE